MLFFSSLFRLLPLLLLFDHGRCGKTYGMSFAGVHQADIRVWKLNSGLEVNVFQGILRKISKSECGEQTLVLIGIGGDRDR